jgi:hypothetical protein
VCSVIGYVALDHEAKPGGAAAAAARLLPPTAAPARFRRHRRLQLLNRPRAFLVPLGELRRESPLFSPCFAVSVDDAVDGRAVLRRGAHRRRSSSGRARLSTPACSTPSPEHDARTRVPPRALLRRSRRPPERRRHRGLNAGELSPSQLLPPVLLDARLSARSNATGSARERAP